jgi:ferric-dicitrate binding protein FerR (iron transport regulator)
MRGAVVLKRPGAENDLVATQGLAFKVGDTIKTGVNSTAQITLTDDSFMNLGPGSAVRVNQYSFDQTAGRRTTIIRVIAGKTRFVVYKLRSSGSSFRVEAGNALLAPGGFANFVVLASAGRTEVVVLDHGLAVRNSLPYVIGNVNVGVNQRSVVKEKEPPTIPVVISPQERKEWLKDVKQK